MKKLRYLIMSVFLICLSAVLILCACGEGDSPSAGGGLVFDKKYVSGAFGEDRENYLLFRSDGTGDYVRNSETVDEHYTIHFKWFYADGDESAVMCFYDSVEYGEDHTGSTIRNSTHYLVTVSERVCTSSNTSSTCYINEDYVGKLENYGKD